MSGSEKPTAIVFDVHLLLLETLARTLELAGISVIGTHGDFGSFIEALEKQRPSVALVGVLLPQTALRIVEDARRVQPGLPMVVIASAANPREVAAVQRKGATAYLDRFDVGCDLVVDVVRSAARGAATPAGITRLPIKTDAPAHAHQLEHLSHRELEVLARLASGMDNLKIAALLGISEHTVKIHVSRLYRKLGQENRTQMAIFARDLGVTLPREDS